MGRLTEGLKTVISFGGTGLPWTTSRSGDVVYTSPWDTDETHAGIRVTADKALSYIPFFAAVRLISEDFASLPLGVYRKNGTARVEQPQHYLHPLLHDSPNPYMTSFSFRETMQSHALTWGNGYAEIEYATDGTIVALWPLRPDRMEVLLNTATHTPFYRYTLTDSTKVDLPKDRIFHYHGLGFDGLTGYSVVSKAAGAIGMAIAGERFSESYMSKGNVPAAVLKYPGKFRTAEARANLRASWDALDHRNRVAILEEGLDLQVIGVPPKDAQFIESAGMLRGMMATLFRLPPHMLSDVERSTSWGTGIEQQNIGYVVHTLRPWIVRFEQQVKLQLLKGDDHFIRFTVDGLLRGDAAARWTSYTQGLDRGVWCIDDILAMEDKNPLPGGKGQTRLVPLNMMPLDQLGEMSMSQRVEVLGQLVRAGFKPDASTTALELPTIEHTGLEPVTVAEQTAKAMKVMSDEFTERETRMMDAFKATLDGIQQTLAQRPTSINVESPQTHIHEGAVQVTNPEPAPVNVTTPEVKVDVHVPEPKPRRVKRTVQRDDKDRITGMTEEPE